MPFEQLGFTTPTQGVAIIGTPAAAGAPTGAPPGRLLMTRDGGHTWSAVSFGG